MEIKEEESHLLLVKVACHVYEGLRMTFSHFGSLYSFDYLM